MGTELPQPGPHEIRRIFINPIARTSGEGDLIDLKFAIPSWIDHIVTQEDIAHGQRVSEYAIDVNENGSWRGLLTGSTIGHKKIDSLPKVLASGIRLTITKSRCQPRISSFAAFSSQI